ncbi:tetratricopeptide repeat protein [Luedemannella flava]
MVTIERDEGGRIVKEAALVAGDLQDTAAQVSAAVTMGRLHGRQLSAESGLVEMRRAAAAAQRAGDLPGLVRAHVNISDLLFDLGAYAESAEVALGGLADAGRVGIGRTTGVFLLANRGEALLALGQWDEADALFGEAARLDPPGTLELLWLMQRARLRLVRGHASAGDLVARAVAFLSLPYLSPQQRLRCASCGSWRPCPPTTPPRPSPAPRAAWATRPWPPRPGTRGPCSPSPRGPRRSPPTARCPPPPSARCANGSAASPVPSRPTTPPSWRTRRRSPPSWPRPPRRITRGGRRWPRGVTTASRTPWRPRSGVSPRRPRPPATGRWPPRRSWRPPPSRPAWTSRRYASG